jgi:ferredoxin
MRTLPMQARITHVPPLGHRISQSGFMVQQPARYWSLPPRRVFAVADDGSLEPFDLATAVCDRLTAATGYRMVLNGCMCRVGLGCENFPQNLGCLGMGEALRPTPPIDGREVDHEEAMQHVQWAIDEGLVPTVAWEWDIQVYGGPMDRGLILCFCDYCHCDLRLSAREGTGRFRRKYVPVPGLTPHVGAEKCTLCGTCAREEVCCVAAVSLGEEASRIDPGLCIRCSRCADVCPEEAISFRLQDAEHAVERLMDEIAEVTDIISTEPVEYGKRAWEQ